MTRVMKQFVVGVIALILMNESYVTAQTYVPVPVTGFTVDGIAESGNDAFAVTSSGLDDQFKILYTKNFAASNTMLNASYPGGIPDNGVISQATAGTFILAPYTGNNILYMSFTQLPNTAPTPSTGRLTLNNAAAYSSMHILGYSTQGNSGVTVTLNFTDGTSQVFTGSTSATNPTYFDWFTGTANIVTRGFGRIARPTSSSPGGPGGAGYAVQGITSSDSSLNDPRMYYINLAVACANRTKLVQSIDFAYLTPPASQQGTQRAVILAVNGLPYTPPTFSYTTTPASCNGGTDGSATVSIVSPGGSTGSMFYVWAPTNSAPTGSATETGLAAGTYTATPTDQSGTGCTYPAITVVVPTASPVSITATASPDTICSGTSSQLTATITGGGLSNVTWTPGGAQGTTTTVSPQNTTTYTVSGTDNNGCADQATVQVVVHQTPTSTYTVAQATLCPGDTATATFTGTAGPKAVYTWNFGSTTTVVPGSTGAGPYQLVFPAGTANTSLKIVDSGCTSTITQHTVTMPDKRAAAFTISQDTICSSKTITVTFTGTGTSSDTYNWDFGGGTTTAGTGAGPYTVQYNTAKDTTVLSLSVSFAGCVTPIYRDSLWVDQSPTAAFSAAPLTGCALQNVIFTNSSTGAAGYIWNLGNKDTTTMPGTITFTHTYDTGSYTITLQALSADGKCESDVTKTNYIKILPKPIASFTSSPDINTPTQLSQAQVTFTNTSQNATNYAWTFGDGGASSDTDPVYKYNTAGDYVVTLYAFNSIGCVDSTSKSFYEIVPDSTLRIPNAFSPNGDGVNDKWVIPGLLGAIDIKLDVYNRWGQRVYTSHGAYEPWDGTYEGKPLPIGTFYYVLVVPATKHTYSGWVLVVK